MDKDDKSGRGSRYWAAACLCSALVGVGISVVLANPGTNPILSNVERVRPVSQIAHYLFQPLTYMAVAALFTFRVIRMRFVGFWSVIFSFIAGGLLATFFLALS